MDYKELIDHLTIDREWAQANEWESPICLQDDLSAAITAVEKLKAYENLMERWKLRSIEEADHIFQRVNALGGTDLMAQYRALGPIDHLRDLLQAEKDGLIPPCKRGDVVYCIRHNPSTGYQVKALTVCTVTVWGPGQFSIFTTKEDVLGKTVFLTRKEAEAALEGGKDHA